MAPISMKTKTKGPISPGTTSSGKLRQKSAMPSFRAVEKMVKDIEEKYDRPADVKKFLDRSRKYQEGLRAGAVPQAGADGIMRLNLVNKGVKDPVTGATILSMQSPQMTAVAPTFGQLAGDIGRGLGSMLEGGLNFITKGGVTGALLQGAKDLFTQPVDTAKRIGYGVQDMMKGYDPFTKQGIGETQKIETQPLPGLDLEAKMSAYEDPIKFYASSSKQKYPQNLYADVSKRDIKTLQPIKDMGLGYDSSINMFSPVIKDLKKKNPSLTDEEIKGIIEGTITEPTGQFAEATKTIMDPYSLIRGTQETLSNLGKTRYGTFGIDNPLDIIRGGTPTLTYEKELGPGVLSGKIGDNKASLGYSMIFNKGGRVRGTGIMGALR